MTSIAIVLMYLFVGLFAGATIWATLIVADALFYAFCWAFAQRILIFKIVTGEKLLLGKIPSFLATSSRTLHKAANLIRVQ